MNALPTKLPKPIATIAASIAPAVNRRMGGATRPAPETCAGTPVARTRSLCPLFVRKSRFPWPVGCAFFVVCGVVGFFLVFFFGVLFGCLLVGGVFVVGV